MDLSYGLPFDYSFLKKDIKAAVVIIGASISNGIIFSKIAAERIAGMVTGKLNKYCEMFSFNRI